MEDQYINVDEMMVDYAEMTSFDFGSSNFWDRSRGCSKQDYTFKYGNYDVLDMLKSMFKQTTVQEAQGV